VFVFVLYCFVFMSVQMSVVIVAPIRLRNFVAGLTNDNPSTTPPVYKQYTFVQYDGTVPRGAIASVSFPPAIEMYRYVIIQNQFDRNEANCMREVQVFTRSRMLLCRYKSSSV